MVQPPMLDTSASANPIQPRYALLINPFYPKDPNASYGKHVLTSPPLRRSTGGFDTGMKTCSMGVRPFSRCLKWLALPYT